MKALAGFALLLLACDERQVLQRPQPTLARMLDQRRGDAFEATIAFPDGKVMRSPPFGTLPIDDESDAPPPAIDRELVELGRARFETICATCHGIRGDGVSLIAKEMEDRKPPSLYEARTASLTREQIFTVATDGYGMMPSLAIVLDRHERWAVASYVLALRISRAARVSELPPAIRAQLLKEAP